MSAKTVPTREGCSRREPSSTRPFSTTAESGIVEIGSLGEACTYVMNSVVSLPAKSLFPGSYNLQLFTSCKLGLSIQILL
jgi:hypothetical protein